MTKHKNKILWAVIVAETSHVFCCLLPIIFSVLSLLSGFGLMSAMPGELVWFHDVMHHYELPMILFSAVVLGIGWVLFMRSEKEDASDDHHHSTECHHQHGAKQHKLTKIILIVASVLFVVNLSVYLGLHRGAELPNTHSAHVEDVHHHSE